ncbi:MAG: type II secretion system protein GspC [Pseudomonadota bacterium]
MDIAKPFKDAMASPENAILAANRVAPPVVNLLLVLAIGWLLARLTLLLLPQPDSGPPPPGARPAVAAQQPDRNDINTQAIVQRHLFGVAPKVADPDAQQRRDDDGPLQDTNLRLTLLGTLAAGDTDKSLAIIEAGNDAKVYAIGDSIQSGVTLDRVMAKQVIIVNRGKRETLPLPRENENGGATARRTTRTASSRSISRNSPARQPVRQVQSLSASSISDLIRPQPVFANGKQRGYRVYPGRQRDQFTALGLKAGDLVTEINGTPLDDPARGRDVFSSLASASQISVTIERNGSPVSLVLDTTQLNLNGQ